ncbi:RNA BINDING PROTEIN [Salix purpurea]|uniref:RNA BINDING PROTEIN n=1 Tax=Salix purpurea TaxID=77065 RepID=A0A9Q0PEE5_SALPP|nr:RNA BINDING PROTEIN [Salix purpurea]
MDRHRGDHQRYHEHQHSNFNQHYPDQNQFNNHNHYNYDSNQQMSGEANEPFSGGLFRFNGRKRGRFHSSDYGDGGVNAKLYIAPIPRTTTEENIRSLFEEHGSIVEVVLPRDKRTGQQQAYCFVKYATFEEADRAIRALHNQHTIPGEVVPFKVRYADGERERPVPRCSVVEGVVDKLYVGSVNKLASKQEIEEIFSPYGHVEDVYIARDELKQSRGCAFVKFAHRDMALAAIKGLNGTVTMRGCDQPLIVRFADPKKPKTGELRGSYAFGGPNLGPCIQQPMIRPAPGCCLPNVSFSMQQTSTTGVPQAVAYAAKQEYAAPHITEQPLSSVKHSPSQLSQMPLQHMQAPEKCFQSPQQAIFDTHKQTQILEQQQNQQIAQQEHVFMQPILTGSTQLAGCNSATSAVPPSPKIVDPEECDWSEHSCPDGYKYYFNCITCESRWEKPVEFTLFQQQFQEQKRLHGSNQQPSLSLVCSAEEVDRTQKLDWVVSISKENHLDL